MGGEVVGDNNTAAVLALIGELYAQVSALTARNQQLEQQLTAMQPKPRAPKKAAS
jgi:outer membrane murein-binding lipoprotein Lpp